MGIFNAIIPIAAGNEAAAREFARSITHEREPEFAAFVGAAGIVRETWTLLATPMGTFLLFWFDGDVAAAMADLATNTTDFATWFRDQIAEIAGQDIGALLAGVQPELVLDWHAA